MLDPATSWFEIVNVPNGTMKEASEQFDRAWLCRYPRPEMCIYDRGGSFIGWEFQELLRSYGIKKKPITAFNPQANAVLERVHQTIDNMIRTMDLENVSLNNFQPWEDILASIGWAVRSTHHTTLGASPGQLVFGRDMIVNTTFIADWNRIHRQKRRSILASNARKNRACLEHQYKAGNQVLCTCHSRKLDHAKHHPGVITQVFSKGTIEVRRGPLTQCWTWS